MDDIDVFSNLLALYPKNMLMNMLVKDFSSNSQVHKNNGKIHLEGYAHEINVEISRVYAQEFHITFESGDIDSKRNFFELSAYLVIRDGFKPYIVDGFVLREGRRKLPCIQNPIEDFWFNKDGRYEPVNSF